ncbi:LOW QUALITY PROTEIN: phospholipase DDHD1-like [Erpetoichthys calabaricus]|uniref:DDHD domain containing 1b n=1 Tax=Erpetoichthys calabaricus TaxID=27687 RepID=A0A8C4SN91_ERPCA|nr:LOW QUALITY PROTEIN: phospholipase DDHD1-like [Erpetoichthys calabaricus]
MNKYSDKASLLSSDRTSPSGAGGEWELGGDAIMCNYDREHFHSAVSSLPTDQDPHSHHLQDGVMLRSGEKDDNEEEEVEEDAAYHSSPSPPHLEPGETDGSVLETRRRVRSSSSRHRYEVVTELGPEEVRWFYKEDKKTWKPFVGHDSLKIELMYRKFCELNPQTKVQLTVTDGSEEEMENDGVAPSGSPDAEELVPDSVSVDVDPVCVRGGLYEVNVREKECYPVYWNQQDRIPVMRGQWFIDGTWLPLEEDESDLIELEHLRRFRGHQVQDSFDTDIVAKPVDSKDAIHSLKLSRSHVDWHCVDEVYLYSDATTSKIARTVTQKLGFSKASSSGTRLHRGYVEEASLEDKHPQATHIVFVVHGIGQKMDQGRIIKNTGMMRDAARKMEEKHFAERVSEHVEFLPVEWRSKLALDGDTVDSITPDKVRGLRDMLNSSAMDIMYYTSPLYRDEITKGLTQELNRLYSLFCSRNPDFEEKGGKVSVVSHSLGCVITYDILTGWDPVWLYQQVQQDLESVDFGWLNYEERQLMEELHRSKQRMKEIKEQLYRFHEYSSAPPPLKFKVENFFCMGSPLAVFLALRGIRPGNNGSQDHIMPKSICHRLFNIFHPTDPVAYRLEPLILKHYSNISPVQINWANTINPIPYEQVKQTLINPVKEPTSASDNESTPSPSTSPVMARRHYGESITSLGKASILGAASIGKGIGGMLFSRFSRSSANISQAAESNSAGLEGEDKRSLESQTSYTMPSLSQSSSAIMDSSVELEHRIDFELREGLVESRYWSAVTSHTSYWSSLDVALFLLTFMYKQDTQELSEDSPDPL